MQQTIFQLLSHANKSIHLYEAEILLARTLKKSKEHIIAHPEINVGFFNSRKYKWLVKKRQKGTPVAYLTGHKEFFGLDFLVNKYTLIPRPETEILVEEVINNITYKLQATSYKLLLIDIGTGSGCIPISIIKAFQPEAGQPLAEKSRLTHRDIQTFAIDVSKKALRVAKKNAQKHNVKIKFLHGNLLQPILNSKFKIQNSRIIITANLPYLTKEQFEQEKSIQHEPKSALVAEDDGLALYKELLQEIKQLITNNPDLLKTNQRPSISTKRNRNKLRVTSYELRVTGYFEIDPSQSERIKKLISNILPEAKIEIKKDLRGQDRLIIINSN